MTFHKKPLKGFEHDHLIGEFLAHQIENVIFHYGLTNIIEMRVNVGTYKQLKAWHSVLLSKGKREWFDKVNIEKGMSDLKLEYIDSSRPSRESIKTHTTIMLIDNYVHAENHRNKMQEQINDPYKQNTNFMQLIQNL